MLQYQYYWIKQKEETWEEIKMKLEEYIAAIIYLEDKYSGKLKDYWTRIWETIPEKLVKIS